MNGRLSEDGVFNTDETNVFIENKNYNTVSMWGDFL